MSCRSRRCLTFTRCLFHFLAVLNVLGGLALLAFSLFVLIGNLGKSQWSPQFALKYDERDLQEANLALIFLCVSSGATCIVSLLSIVSLCRASVCLLSFTLVFNLIRVLVYIAISALTRQFDCLLGVLPPALVLLLGGLVLRDMKGKTKRETTQEVPPPVNYTQ